MTVKWIELSVINCWQKWSIFFQSTVYAQCFCTTLLRLFTILI